MEKIGGGLCHLANGHAKVGKERNDSLKNILSCLNKKAINKIKWKMYLLTAAI